MAQRINKKRLVKLIIDASLSALIVVLAFTPLGYLKIGVVSVTFISIPVVVGAIINGPGSGAFLGGVFGLTSFLQCFGLDIFGTTLFSINPFFTAVMCFVPRILMGLLCGLIYSGISKKSRNDILNFSVTSLSGGVLNTVLFVGTLILLFGSSDYLRSFGDSIPAIISALVTFNAVIEWIACLAIGTAVAKASLTVYNRKR